ncbi:MAG: mraW [Candidatus Nomurabacteria bacterium]|nr:mraW [Candidatus Nomurabacteria bacterium]
MHVPVLLNESIEGLNISPGGVYVDCTTNRGGHSIEIAKAIGHTGTLICLDLDQEALKAAEERISSIPNAPKLHFVHSNFRSLKDVLKNLSIERVNGVLADLGLSSEELDISKRGFSFRFDEKLQMTFNSHPGEEDIKAEDIVNDWSEESIADILYGFADERYSRKIAKGIVESRKEKRILTTQQLVDIISRLVPPSYRHKKTHFATKTFQAIRMAVNDEVGSLTELIDSLEDVLVSGGRACFITFHSTEDRIVKQKFRALKDSFVLVNKKAIVPKKEEIINNPRARSSQLRIIEKV